MCWEGLPYMACLMFQPWYLLHIGAGLPVPQGSPQRLGNHAARYLNLFFPFPLLAWSLPSLQVKLCYVDSAN